MWMPQISPLWWKKPRCVCSCSCSMPNLEWVFTSTGDGRFSCSLQKPVRRGKDSETDIFRASGRRLGLERLELKSSEEWWSRAKMARNEAGAKRNRNGRCCRHHPGLTRTPLSFSVSQVGALTPELSLVTSCRPLRRVVKLKISSCFCCGCQHFQHRINQAESLNIPFSTSQIWPGNLLFCADTWVCLCRRGSRYWTWARPPVRLYRQQ